MLYNQPNQPGLRSLTILNLREIERRVQCRRTEQKKGSQWSFGSRSNPQYSEGGRAVHMAKGLTEVRSLQRKHCPTMLGRNHNANHCRE